MLTVLTHMKTQDTQLEVSVEHGTVSFYNSYTSDWIGIFTSEWAEIRDKIDKALAPRTDLQGEVDQLWNLSPKLSRARSSRKQLYDKWKAHRKYAPGFAFVLASLRDWCNSRPWRDGYCEGIHRWVQNHKWEVEPEHLDAPKPSGFRSADVGI